MTSPILITGATGYLGSAFAIYCARRGFDLYLTDLAYTGGEFADYLRETYPVQVHYQACDLTSVEARTEFYGSLKSSGDHFWGLINVAGLDFEGPFMERSREQILRILHVNVEATLDTTYSILKLRDKERRFMLINTCSLAAYIPMPYKAVYAATKRLLLDFSLAIREEIRPYGTVTALCPAGLPTTPETMRAIFAQGFWGKMTTMDTATVAHRTIGCALKGKPVYIPGMTNRLVQWFGSLTPRMLAVSYVGNRWKAAQTERQVWSLAPYRHSAEKVQA